MTATRLVDDSLFADGGPSAEADLAAQPGPTLLGATCRACATTTFPRQPSCPRCTGTDMDDTALPRRGTLWSFTVQGFRPKPPFAGSDSLVPYGVGYVDLAGTVIVEGILTENDPARLRIGEPMDLVFLPLRADADGTQVLTYAFAPVR
jgi:uncharacterized protein